LAVILQLLRNTAEHLRTLLGNDTNNGEVVNWTKYFSLKLAEIYENNKSTDLAVVCNTFGDNFSYFCGSVNGNRHNTD
jgi:hypothetical protein